MKHKDLFKRYDLLMEYAYKQFESRKNPFSEFERNILVFISHNFNRATTLLKYYSIKRSYTILSAEYIAGKKYI